VKIYVDGNPTRVYCSTEDNKVDRASIEGVNTDNVAGYRAVLFGLYKHPGADEVCSSSQLAVKQLTGKCAVKDPKLLSLWSKVKARIEALEHEVKFTWVPRSENPAGRIL